MPGRKLGASVKRILFVKKQLPYPVNHGGHLRVINLARKLGECYRCDLAVFDDEPQALKTVSESDLFESILTLKPVGGSRSWRRLLRTDNGHRLQYTYPEHFRAAIDTLSDYIRNKKVDAVIASNLNVAEYVARLTGVTRIVDDFDCLTLTMERQYRVERAAMSRKQRLSYWLELGRVRRQESRLNSDFDLVTTIAAPDRERLVQLGNSGKVAIHIVPNGIDRALLKPRESSEQIQNAVIFWGNLSFPPNRSAVEYFYREIYLKHLVHHGVKWFIAGPEADSWIKSLPSLHREIEVTGFVEDLYGLVSSIPVVINPMIMGSGLKNKVLEAFALEKPVVSTSMGVEAINVGQEHCIQCDGAAGFAQAVLKLLEDEDMRRRYGRAARELVLQQFTWESVGAKWERLVTEAVETGSGEPASM